jgi:hypothetical protein
VSLRYCATWHASCASVRGAWEARISSEVTRTVSPQVCAAARKPTAGSRATTMTPDDAAVPPSSPPSIRPQSVARKGRCVRVSSPTASRSKRQTQSTPRAYPSGFTRKPTYGFHVLRVLVGDSRAKRITKRKMLALGVYESVYDAPCSVPASSSTATPVTTTL